MKMIRNNSFLFALLALPFADANGAPPATAPQRAVASGRNDVVYLAPATEPYEALPLGNGRLGVMMRNQGGLIRVFPAWPKGWQSEFTLAAEGGFLVSSRVSTNGEIPEIRIRSQLGGACTVVNPWPGDAMLRTQQGTRTLTQTNRFVVATKPGDEFILTPAVAAPEFEPIPVTRNDAPQWPFHQGLDDTIEKYLKRTRSFGMLGIAKDGQNLTRNKVQKELAEQRAKATGVK
jgi:hypothetical protein